MILEDGLFNRYSLSEKDHLLLEQYLSDIRVDEMKVKQSKLVKFLTKVVFKLYK